VDRIQFACAVRGAALQARLLAPVAATVCPAAPAAVRLAASCRGFGTPGARKTRALDARYGIAGQPKTRQEAIAASQPTGSCNP
jgi:hypothetical protein